MPTLSGSPARSAASHCSRCMLLMSLAGRLSPVPDCRVANCRGADCRESRASLSRASHSPGQCQACWDCLAATDSLSLRVITDSTNALLASIERALHVSRDGKIHQTGPGLILIIGGVNWWWSSAVGTYLPVCRLQCLQYVGRHGSYDILARYQYTKCSILHQYLSRWRCCCAALCS